MWQALRGAERVSCQKKKVLSSVIEVIEIAASVKTARTKKEALEQSRARMFIFLKKMHTKLDVEK